MLRVALNAILLISSVGLMAQSPVERIDPPNWWVGMEKSSVQLMLQGDGLASWKVTLSEQSPKGFEILQTIRTENSDYLFIDLLIDESAKAGVIDLVFTRGRKERRVEPYPFLERAPRERGLDPSDLIYLIMPDRFANGDASNDVVKGMQEMLVDRDSVHARHGGDIQGITSHLDYLQNTGVTALWLNPVQTNDQPEYSYHGYAATDFYEIDPRFGSMQDYLELSERLHGRDMKLIMDVVHNHVGDQHYTVLNPPTATWFHQWEEFTRTTYRAPTLMDPYASKADRKLMIDGWFDIHMPDLNQSNPLVANWLIQNNIWWIETAGLDGLRMDTWAYSEPDFLVEWTEAVMREYPDLGVFAETWVHGSLVQGYFHGQNILDTEFQTGVAGLTDFQLYYAINEAANDDPSWTGGINRMYYTMAKDFVYRDPMANVVFLDNHDLNRYAHTVASDSAKIYMGINWLMTVRGIPMIYYGTELGMSSEGGEHSAGVRQDFPGGWAGDERSAFEAEGRTADEQEVYSYLQNMANWRKGQPAIHSGRTMQYVPEDGVYVYFRYTDDQTVMVVMNGTSEAKTLDLSRFSQRLDGFSTGIHPVSGQRYSLSDSLELIPRGSYVLELRR